MTPADTHTAHNNLKGLFFNIISMLLFVCMDVLIKKLTVIIPVYEIMFYRCLFGLPIFITVISMTSGTSTLIMHNKKLHILRGLLGVGGMYFFFLSYKYLPLVEVASIIFSAPLFLTILSVIFLKERLGVHRISAIILGFIGVLFIIRPMGISFSMHSFLPLIGALFWCGVIFTMRSLSKTDHANSVTLTFSIAGILITGVIMMSSDTPSVADVSILPDLVLVGTLGTFAQMFMMQAVSNCETVVFASTKYMSLVFATIAGYIYFNEIPIFYTTVGMVLIIVSGLYIVYREYTLNKIQKIRTVRY